MSKPVDTQIWVLIIACIVFLGPTVVALVLWAVE